VSVRVDDIDNAGKLSLSLVGDDDESAGGEPAPRREPAPEREPVSVGASGGNGEGRETVSFEDSWEDTARSEFGDLGPDDESRERSSGGGGGAGRRGGRRGGGRR